MERLENYISKNFSINFFSIFLPLFIVASVIFLIRMASITAIIELSIFEMLKLYLFMLPELLFYTLPLSFFVGGVVTLIKLSFDSEMVVLFSLGISPYKIYRIFFRVGLLTTFFLLFNSLIMMPHTKQMYKNFISYKKAEAVLNIKATEFGQKFGNWSIFIESIDNKSGQVYYNNIALVYKSGGNERFITADRAKVSNNLGVVELKLNDGTVFSYRMDKISKMKFKEMVINNVTDFNLKPYKDTVEYIEFIIENDKQRAILIRESLLSLFPVLSTIFILIIGIQQLRHGKNWSNILIGAVIGLYYVSVFTFTKKFGLFVYLMIPIWIVFAYLVYYFRVLRRY